MLPTVLRFHFDPFIIVDDSWVVGPSGREAVKSKVDGVNEWFLKDPTHKEYSTHSHTGYSGTFTTGVTTPGFWAKDHDHPSNPPQIIDRTSGQKYDGALTEVMSQNLVIIEGFTDVAENAGSYRGANSAPPSCPFREVPLGDEVGQLWTAPNQYLNVLRKHTAPNPRYVVFEAEAADVYSPSSSGPSTNYRRTDGKHIEFTDPDHPSQWAVELNQGDSAEFRAFQTGGSTDWTWRVTYKSDTGATARLLIDDVQKGQRLLGETGGQYKWEDVGLVSFGAGEHNIRLEIQTGAAWVDSWTLDAFGLIVRGANQHSVSFAAADNHYVVAENDGGGVVNANREQIGGWETFTIIDVNGGDLSNNDEVVIETGTPFFFRAENGGGSTLDATNQVPHGWEHFNIHKVTEGDAVIRNGDAVKITTTTTGDYLVVDPTNEQHRVYANGSSGDPWTIFTVVIH